ncbi:hypothetical protein Lal_00032146 [Lupinus albus]|nr:hypothetical protein Lal_00032146 [Lupinus albus]
MLGKTLRLEKVKEELAKLPKTNPNMHQGKGEAFYLFIVMLNIGEMSGWLMNIWELDQYDEQEKKKKNISLEAKVDKYDSSGVESELKKWKTSSSCKEIQQVP